MKALSLIVMLLGTIFVFVPSIAAAQSRGSYYYCGGSGPQFVPAGEHLFCSATFQFETDPGAGGDGTTCDGVTDMVTHWAVGGAGGKLPSWHITPFENQPINIIGIQMVMGTMTGHTMNAMAGNNSIPDIMAHGGPGATEVHEFFPPGYVMPWPAKQDAKPGDYLDFHYGCTGGGYANWQYEVDYTPVNPIRPPGKDNAKKK